MHAGNARLFLRRKSNGKNRATDLLFPFIASARAAGSCFGGLFIFSLGNVSQKLIYRGMENSGR